MDIVVRTPHGDADVSIIGHAPTTTLGDIIAEVTGQAVPTFGLLDDRAVDAGTPLDELALRCGSVVTTEPTLPEPTSPADRELVQIAGHGAGRSVRLAPGRYRLGPGHRVTSDELHDAPVERAAFDLVIDPDATTGEATVVPIGADVELDGQVITAATPWRDETLTIGTRAFRLQPLDADAMSPDRGSAALAPTLAGLVAFSRPPRPRVPPQRWPVADATRDATRMSMMLWSRRPSDPDAFTLPIGVVVDRSGNPNVTSTITTTTLDLSDHQAVAIAGSERFRYGLARTALVEAVTLHGPADLDVVVLTSPERIAEWDWAKWLPHVRLDGPAAIWSGEREMTRWADAMTQRAASGSTPSTPSHLTLAIIDDPTLWSRRESPLRAIVSHPPDGLRIIALCDRAAQAPAICTAAVSETPNGYALLHSFNNGVDVDEILPALTEIGAAARVARGLAPLADIEIPAPAPVKVASRIDAIGMIGIAGAHDVLARWASDERPQTVTIGRRDEQPVLTSATDDVTVVVSSSISEAFDVAASSILAQCVERSPERLWVVPLVVTDPARSDFLFALPHSTERHDTATPFEAGRLIARARAALDDPAGPERIIVYAEDSHLSPASLDDALLDALVQGSRSTVGLSVLVVTDRAEMRTVDADSVIRVRREEASGTTERRRTATTSDRHGHSTAAFTPVEPSMASSGELELEPMVIGRPLTPLERRLERRRAGVGGAPDPALHTVVDWLREAARVGDERVGDERVGSARPRPAVVPPPLPTQIDLEEFFASTPGDSVPVGIADDPATGELRPRWWQPGDGSVLAVGSRRSGVEQMLWTIALGIIDRFAPEDVGLIVIESSTSRRRALSGTDRAVTVRATDRADDVSITLDEVQAELDHHAGIDSSSRDRASRLVVVIGDIGHVRLRLTGQLRSRFDDVLAAAARSDSGVDVIAYASDLAGAGPFGEHVAQCIVGASSDSTELAALGVDDPAELEGIVGRCRWFPEGALVQLASAEVPVENLLARRSPGGGP